MNNTAGGPTDSFAGKTVELGGSFALSGIWTAIGTSANPFKGTFEGHGKTISGLYVDTTGANQGLFGYTSGGGIQNLTVTGSVYSDGDYAGGLSVMRPARF